MSKATILLLEDDIQLNDTIRQFLNFKGYEVVTAYDGYRAEELLHEKTVDLMLLDVKVPHLDGFTLLQKIRGRTLDIPAIFITSLHSVDDVEKGFASGCDDYLRKPFSLKELSVRVDALLKRRFGVHCDEVPIGDDCIFDTVQMQLYRNGVKVALKNKELKLLALFLRYKGRLLTYEEIYEALWEYAEPPSIGALRAYVKNLRSVLGKECIETVKNSGYRFVTG